MKFTDTLEGDLVIIEISGKIMGGEETTMFHGRIHEYIKLNKKNFLINLKKVEWMNSVGLGMLISALTTVRNAGGRLVLANNDVLWSGSVCVTSLDLAASAEAPAVSATATRAYRFSEKLRAWVADKWELATRDNFSASFADWQADHHRRALIRHAVNEFLGGLK